MPHRRQGDLLQHFIHGLPTYAVSIGRVLFDASPETVECQVLSSAGPDKVDAAFSMLATYSGGRSIVGHFGFDTAYRNHLDVMGESLVAEADRVFTIPAEVENEVLITDQMGSRVMKAPPCNPFRPFFASVFEGIARGEWQSFGDDLFADAQGLQRLRDAAGVV